MGFFNQRTSVGRKCLVRSLSALGLSAGATFAEDAVKPDRPNILLIVADDLGYGDVGCYGATKIKTPNMDRLATDGIRLTDAHSAAAVCQPARYSILSGRYWWRSTPNPGYSYYFDEGEILMPQLLKQAGYRTVGFGKWHLGFDTKPFDINKALTPGTKDAGFDYYFGTTRSHNEPPFVFFENDHCYKYDPADPIRMISQKEKPHPYGWGSSEGGAAAHAARPEDEIDLVLTDRAVDYLEKQSDGHPFFMYLAYTAPHFPIVPNKKFIGTSEADRYGDFVQQLDFCVGRVLDTLEKKGMTDNTLVFLTSDNGAVNTGEPFTAGHRSNGELLGQKTDAWDGGHKVPCIVRWPARLPGRKTSGILFGLNDLMATILAAADVPVPKGTAPDSLNQLPVLAGEKPFVRTSMVYQGVLGFALRQGPWVYLPEAGSQGFTTEGRFGVPYEKMGFENTYRDKTGKLLPDAPPDQLYNVQNDPGEKKNVVREHPEKAKEMAAVLQKLLGPNPLPVVKRPKQKQ
ncbi:sulfatase family protein [Tichowtungia aerotolerans]|uniref:Sulfatase-like hydrolase/transferase n=1 Tax=Tichowtungia aerotolerans TaxID=2697043 RepID=A0A6P1M6Y4_9BACT|nr:arylsulfatase [Tichowtungia aerotolerans]QHI69782.1 sulfatase-like hydrolase/transferase [Tichowtungia aerotolerans]